MGKILCFLLAVVLLTACRKSEEAVVARVGRSVITESEFQRKLGGVDPSYQNYVMTPYGRKQFHHLIVREKLMLKSPRDDLVA